MSLKQFSPRHKKAPGRTFNPRKKIDAMYDKAWELYRAKFLERNGCCYACGQRASVVDHLTPHKGDILLFKDLKNHIPLCARCHNTITTKFDRNYKVGAPILEKLKWIQENRDRWKIIFAVKVLPSYVVVVK